VASKKERSDARLHVARYRIDGSTPGPEDPGDDANTAGQPTLDQFAQYVEIAIQQSMRRGDFDDLPGAGKPLTNLAPTYDPNWWIRQKIERENITGLGPPALTLRTENSQLDARLDSAPSEHAVREILHEFNRRVVEARRQLLGGPPVVTPTRDVDVEVERWRQRRDARLQALAEERAREDAARAQMTRRERRRTARRDARRVI
jgi:hypothetical protein